VQGSQAAAHDAGVARIDPAGAAPPRLLPL
jgi:hypothetical protein